MTYALKKSREQKQIKPKVSRRKKVIKNRSPQKRTNNFLKTNESKTLFSKKKKNSIDKILSRGGRERKRRRRGR